MPEGGNSMELVVVCHGHMMLDPDQVVVCIDTDTDTMTIELGCTECFLRDTCDKPVGTIRYSLSRLQRNTNSRPHPKA